MIQTERSIRAFVQSRLIPSVRVRGKQALALLPMLVALGLGGACQDEDPSGIPDAAIPSDDADLGPTDPHVIYLLVEGGLLQPGVNNAMENTSSFLQQDFDVPPFLDGDSQRASRIDLILTTVKDTLAPYNLEVVTDRPTSGSYQMIVVGGTAEAAGDGPGALGTAPSSCAGPIENNIALVYEVEPFEEFRYATSIIGAIGLMQTVPLSNLQGDCMCWNGDQCTFDNTMCTIGGPGTPLSVPGGQCGTNGTVMDEHALWLEAFGAAP